jgi:ATP-dependent phosphofructokinase / diphosphate-dependent phosphofructokinase
MANSPLKRVAMLFAGGPAPAANAVIGTAAVAFLNAGIEVIGIKHGYSHLIDYDGTTPLVEGEHYINITHADLSHRRTSQGIMIGTARTNPGKNVSALEHLKDPVRSAPLGRVYQALCDLGVDGLISIGGDDTLKTANKMKLYQDTLPDGSKKIPVVHLPKTIDNDYMGIDFTFGYFTAAEFLATEMRNLNYDAAASQSYYLCEAMGRSAGWLAYGAAIAGEACMVLSVEDITGSFRSEETVTDAAGKQSKRRIMNVDMIAERIVKLMLAREAQGRPYGVLVVAEGMAEYLPYKYLEGIARDEHGHIAIANINLSKMLAKIIAETYTSKTGKSRKITGLQLGYESRCALPHAFDVMLGSQIGVGAFRALVEKQLNGVMISVSGQLDLRFVPFEELVDPQTLVTKVRYIEVGSDFHRLAKFVETYVDD